MPRRLAAILVLVLVTGCAGSYGGDSPTVPPPFRVGDHARYTSPDTPGASVEVVVADLGTVLDADRSPRRAVTFWRWINGTGIATQEVVDAVDSETGRLIWSAAPCEPSSDAWCDGRSTFFLGLRGNPGAWNHAWARLGQVDAASSCRDVRGAGHPIHESPFPPFLPDTFVEGEDSMFCAHAPFPASVVVANGTLLGGERLELASFARGSGPVVQFDGNPLPSPTRPALPASPWNGRYPPEPTYHGDAFPLEEAWAWMQSASPSFAEFARENPQPHVARYGFGGWEGGGLRPLPVLERGANLSSTERREIRIGASSDESLHVVLEKTCTFDARCEIRESSSEVVAGRGARPPPAGQEMIALGAVAETVADAFELPVSRVEILLLEVHATSYYAYRVILGREPSSSASAGMVVRTPPLAYVRADTGDWFYAHAEPSIWMPRED